MRKSILSVTLFFIVFLLIIISCKKSELAVNAGDSIRNSLKDSSKVPFDSTLIRPFFVKYPKLGKYQSDVEALYRKYQYNYIWIDSNQINEVGNLLYNKINNLDEEGVEVTIPYKVELDALFQNLGDTQKPNIDSELLISSMYFFYADKVYKGIDPKKTDELGWYLPRKKQSYVNYLDSLLQNPTLINKNEKGVIRQYYRLREVLKKYREIEKKEKWEPIVLDSTVKSFSPGDSSKTIALIRQRLYVLGDISSDSKSALYDSILAEGVLKYKKRNAFKLDNTITPRHLASINIPISERIKTIIINMERCRWLSTDLTKAKELIVINIPAYQLVYYKNGEPVLISKVVVGKDLNKTVIFSADMKYIVFSPYWNVPKSIIEKEIAPAMAKNKNYLSQHDMEWNNGDIRQKPGPKNSLGLVKFLFPNSNSIYLHDTPSKELFNEEKRAFSHGCIRIAKPKELANLILKDDKNWTPEKIDAAMNSGEESWYAIKNKIPVYIGYFTAWVDADGLIYFYEDVYQRDAPLQAMLLSN